MFDSVVIGGGPGGASCALWLKLLGRRPCIVESGSRLGGLQSDSPYRNEWIPSVMDKSGADFAADIHRHVMEHAIECKFERRAVGITPGGDFFRVALDDGEHVDAKTVVLATGVRPISGGFEPSPTILVGPGSRVATQDYRGKRVAILGGGDNAFENYLFALAQGAASARIFARSIRTRKDFLDRVPPHDVEINAEFGDNARFAAAWRRYDLILVMYGWEASLSCLGELELARGPRGFVRTDAECRTSIEGVYAVGEVAQRSHPCCVTAMADGVIAAKAIQQRLEKDAIDRFEAAVRRASEPGLSTVR